MWGKELRLISSPGIGWSRATTPPLTFVRYGNRCTHFGVPYRHPLWCTVQTPSLVHSTVTCFGRHPLYRTIDTRYGMVVNRHPLWCTVKSPFTVYNRLTLWCTIRTAAGVYCSTILCSANHTRYGVHNNTQTRILYLRSETSDVQKKVSVRCHKAQHPLLSVSRWFVRFPFAVA